MQPNSHAPTALPCPAQAAVPTGQDGLCNILWAVCVCVFKCVWIKRLGRGKGKRVPWLAMGALGPPLRVLVWGEKGRGPVSTEEGSIRPKSAMLGGTPSHLCHAHPLSVLRHSTSPFILPCPTSSADLHWQAQLQTQPMGRPGTEKKEVCPLLCFSTHVPLNSTTMTRQGPFQSHPLAGEGGQVKTARFSERRATS